MLRLLTWLLTLLCATTAYGQTTAQFPIQFDFLNPGARSLALGSAFTGLADDATAAFTNPAGLIQLGRPEISVEGRFRRLKTRFLVGGRISGNVLNIGEDRILGPVYGNDEDSGFGASFVSFTYPVRRWAIAGYRHELSRVENEFLYRGVFERATFAGVTDDRSRDIPLVGERRIAIDSYGAAGAVRLNDKVTVGAGINVLRFELDAAFRRTGLTDLFSAPDLTQTGSTATQAGDDLGVGFNMGILAQLSREIRVGAVFRRAPDFEFTQVDTIPFRPTLTRTGQFQVPDTLGIGVAWRPASHVVLAADYVRVGYQSLKEDFIDFQAISSGREDQLSIQDGNEFHLGLEWVFTDWRGTPALRGGFWFDPEHTVRYVSNGSGDQLDTRFRFILPGDDDLWHYTFGGGLSLSRVFEINGAADLTKRSSYASASLIVRFW